MKIHDFALQGHIGGVKQQLTNGVNIDCLDKSSQTPLMCAVSSTNTSLEMMQFLVALGIDIHYQRPGGYDVLIDAVYGYTQCENLVSILIERRQQLK